MLAAAAIPLLLIALWVRTPTLPQTAGGGSGNGAETLNAAEGAIRALERALDETRSRLASQATSSLDAPGEQEAAFDYLAKRSTVRDGEAILLYRDNQPVAWTGVMRIRPDSIKAPVSVTFSPFYTTLNVVATRGNRRAVATAVLEAFPPADRFTQTLENLLATQQGVTGYDFSPPANARGGPIVLTDGNAPVVRAIPRLATPEEMRFRRASSFRARGTIALVILSLVFLFFAWRNSRRQLAPRLFAIAIALVVTALVRGTPSRTRRGSSILRSTLRSWRGRLLQTQPHSPSVPLSSCLRFTRCSARCPTHAGRAGTPSAA